MRAKSRRLQAEHGLDLIIIDYIQLMQGRGRFENRTQELASISRALKGLAKELGVPVVALSQLSRAPESRADRRPQLADLRESGALEQDADVVMFIFREEMYDQKPENEGIAEIIIGKQGGTGLRVPFGWPSSSSRPASVCWPTTCRRRRGGATGGTPYPCRHRSRAAGVQLPRDPGTPRGRSPGRRRRA